jgi:hypothetical protein
MEKSEEPMRQPGTPWTWRLGHEELSAAGARARKMEESPSKGGLSEGCARAGTYLWGCNCETSCAFARTLARQEEENAAGGEAESGRARNGETSRWPRSRVYATASWVWTVLIRVGVEMDGFRWANVVAKAQFWSVSGGSTGIQILLFFPFHAVFC